MSTKTSENTNGMPHLEEAEDGEVEDGEIEDDSLPDAGTIGQTTKAEVGYIAKYLFAPVLTQSDGATR